MGFFSWQTADTKESIANVYTGHCRPVYLLQPNGKPPIYEPEYAGYGEFGDKNAYVWLAENNLPEAMLDRICEDELHDIGLELFLEGCFEDKISEVMYPLKFSFSKDAVYEDLPASNDCPYQGFFLIDNGVNLKDSIIKDLVNNNETILVFDFSHASGDSIGVISETIDNKTQAHIYNLEENFVFAKIWMEVEHILAEHNTYSQHIDEISHFVNNDDRVGQIHKDDLELYQ